MITSHASDDDDDVDMIEE